MGLCIGCFEWVADMKKITVQDRAEKFINELGKYAVGNFKYWFPFCKLQKNISVIAYDLDRIYKENCIEQIERVLHTCKICVADSFQNQMNNPRFKKKYMIRLLYEKDGIGYNFPWYVETFYCDPSRRWMIYVSHEGTITFTGNEITQAANRIISSQYMIK